MHPWVQFSAIWNCTSFVWSPIVSAIRASPSMDSPVLSDAVTIFCGLGVKGSGQPSSRYCSKVMIEEVLPESSRQLNFISVPAIGTSTYGLGSSGAMSAHIAAMLNWSGIDCTVLCEIDATFGTNFLLRCVRPGSRCMIMRCALCLGERTGAGRLSD